MCRTIVFFLKDVCKAGPFALFFLKAVDIRFKNRELSLFFFMDVEALQKTQGKTTGFANVFQKKNNGFAGAIQKTGSK